MKIIIDTDCGVDDAFAIIAAIKMYNVVGITCVSGNVHVDNVVNNVGVILELEERQDIPFYRGCSDFILNSWQPSPYLGHGSDGLGDTGLKSSLVPANITAVDALIMLTKTYENIHLIALGPLTNIALATLIDPDFPNRVKSFTIMGGAHHCKGNVGFASEFNIHCDPEAAKICFTKFKMTRMITWETTCECFIPWDLWNSIVQQNNKRAKFISAISKKAVSICKDDKEEGFVVCDLIAVCSFYAENKHKSQDLLCNVELAGLLTRGATVFDWSGKSKPNVCLVKVDQNKVLDFVKWLLIDED